MDNQWNLSFSVEGAQLFELIKAIVEPVAKSLSVSDLLAGKDRSHRRNIGTELFVFYNSVNEIVVSGWHIVGEIERVCSWMQRKLNEGKPDETLSTDIPFWLGVQRIGLLKAVHSIRRLGLELEMIDRVSYLGLLPLIHGQSSAISGLIDRYPSDEDKLVTYDEHLLQGACDKFIASAASLPPVRPNKFTEKIDTYVLMIQILPTEQQHQMCMDAQRVVLKGLDYIPASRVSEFLNYLNDEKPAERLEAIERVLDGLRSVLETNFSIADVLLEVNDRRASATDVWSPAFNLLSLLPYKS